jgi:Uri superfamily endonuclease
MMEPLPEAKGTYILVVRVEQMRRLEIGSLGKFDIVPGYYCYCYVGSAVGAGGLRARLGHHLGSAAAPHWQIDYLLQFAVPVEVWYTTDERRLESRWADLLEKIPGFRVPIFAGLVARITTAAGPAICSIPSANPPSGSLKPRFARSTRT